MLETLIAILLSLGLNFSQTENGCIQIDQGAMSKLETNDEYLKNFPKGDSPIVIVPDIDPIESPIVLVPAIDPVR